jgi:hypothetical protein
VDIWVSYMDKGLADQSTTKLPLLRLAPVVFLRDMIPRWAVEVAHRGIYLLTHVHELGHSPPVICGVAQVVLESA